MERDYKHNSSNAGGVESGTTVPLAPKHNRRKMKGCDVILRFLALALSLTAAVVLGVNKETTTVAVELVPSLPPINVPLTAKWHYLSSSVFFVVANSIACAHAGISLLLVLANMGSGRKGAIATMIALFDLAMVALLFSGVGATISVGLIGLEGNSHLQWKKICNVFDKYCFQGGAAIGLSCGASLVFFVLVVFTIMHLHKKH